MVADSTRSGSIIFTSNIPQHVIGDYWSSIVYSGISYAPSGDKAVGATSPNGTGETV